MSSPTPSAKDVLVLAQMVELVRAGTARTRSEREAVTGLGRAVVNDRLREGVELRVLAEIEAAPTGERRGRPSRAVRFRSEAGLILSACLGEVSLHAAVTDLDGRALAREFRSIDVQRGSAAVLGTVHELFQQLLREMGGTTQVWGIGIGLPGPMDYPTGRVVDPPAIPGWAGFDVRSWFGARYDTPVWVDNEVNLMALGEWERGVPQERRDLLFVKVGTGIGSGLVTGGRLHRGDSGAAGDIGHVRVIDDPYGPVPVRQDRMPGGGGRRLGTHPTALRARPVGPQPAAGGAVGAGRITGEDIGHATAEGDPLVRDAVARAARISGRAIAGVVNFANPGTLVLGGGVLRSGPLFFEEFRTAVLDGTIELAARNLHIRTPSLDFAEGITGGALLVAQNLLRPEALRIWLADGTPVGAAQQLQAAA